MLDASGTDTIWQWSRSGPGELVWTSDGRERWRSRGALPDSTAARLRMIDADSAPDLFWSFQTDSAAGGMVLLAKGPGVKPAFGTGGTACAAPALADVTGDGRPDVLSNVPTDDALCLRWDRSRCEEQYPAYWTWLYSQSDAGFVLDTVANRRFYRQLAVRYGQAAARLNRVLAADSSAGPCDRRMVSALRALAWRAEHIAEADSTQR
jgi:hypothetical protein